MSDRKKKRKFIKLDKSQYPFDIKKYLTLRNLLIMLLLITLYLFFAKDIQAILLIIVFYPISLFAARTTKYVKHVSTDTIAAFTVFLGYLYGWKWGLFFGLGIGLVIWSQTALNLLTMINLTTYGVAAIAGHLSAGWFGSEFYTGYVVAIMIRNVYAFTVFLLFNPNVVENFTHTFSEFITNTLLYPIVLNILYGVIIFLTP